MPFRREKLPPKLTEQDHDENGIIKDSHIFHSQFHDFVTLDTTPLKIDRDLKGNRLMQIVLRPFGMLRRADHTTARWQHFNRRCVVNAFPRDLFETDAAKIKQ